MSISHATWSMCWKRHPWPQSVIMLNVLNSGQFGWKTSRAIPKWSQEWCCSSLFPWSQSWTSAGVGNVWDTLLMEVLPLFSHLCPQLVLISGAETCVWQFKDQQECQIVPKSLKCSRIVRLSQSPWRALATWSWLTGTASCTTLSTLNSNSLSWTGLRSGVEKSWI